MTIRVDCCFVVQKQSGVLVSRYQSEWRIMLLTFFIVLASIALFGFAVYLFVIEPRGKIHDL